MSSFDRVRDAVDPTGLKQRGNDRFMARCPIHADREASLSVQWRIGSGGSGMVLLHCHGCHGAPADIAEALGLSMSDLFDEPLPARDPLDRVGRSSSARVSGKRRPKGGRLPALLAAAEAAAIDSAVHEWVQVRSYPYTEASGRLVQEVVREECTSCGSRHKTFKQAYFTATGGRRKQKPADFEPVLFRMPLLSAAIADRRSVWIMEGEKDAETAESLGLVATTNVGGALSFPESLAGLFDGADVVVVLDRDDAGWRRGAHLAELLGTHGAHVRLLLPATLTPKSDFTDHVDGGLWDESAPWGGLISVGAREVLTHASAADVREKQRMVEQALEQTTLRSELVAALDPDSAAATEERARVTRWAVEAERRFEPLGELVDRVRQHAAEAGTEWAGEAVDDATNLWRSAQIAARAAHEIAGMAIPPALQEVFVEIEPEPLDGAGHAESVGGVGHKDWARADVLVRGGGATTAPEPGVRGRNVIAPVYRHIDGNLVEIVTTKDGDQKAKLVLGIDARIVEMEYLEVPDASLDVDEPVLMGREAMTGQVQANPPATEELTAVVIGYHHPDSGEFELRRIPAKEYRDCGWVDSLPGPPAYDSRPAGVAKLRDALKGAGGPFIRRVIRFRSTGWRRDEAGCWFFVHAGGAISAEGGRVAPVLLTGPLRMFDLPAPIANGTRIREAFLGHSGAMLERIPGRVSASLLGHVYRSALGPNPWLLALIGSPGSYKTSIASLVMHHWGEKWDRRRPATSMSGNGDTLNALRIKLNASKDALYWADDVAPTRDFGTAQKSLEEFARLVHNGEQRSRSTRDGLGVLDGTPPRASAMVTSEVMPRPGSGAQRMFVVPLQAAEIDLDVLRNFDDELSRHGRALLMASFLMWLCPKLDEVRAEAFAEGERYADDLRAGGESVRQADALGALWAGWYAMTRFLTEVGALSQDEADEVGDLVAVGLGDAAVAATDPDMPMRTGARVRELLAHALNSGLAYVDDVETGGMPDWPLASRLGWRRTVFGTDATGHPRYREETRGIRLGFVVAAPRGDGEPELLMDSTALEQVLKAAGGSMTDAPQFDRGTAQRALYDEGILIAEERKGRTPRYTVQRQIRCEDRRHRMVALRLHQLLGGDGADPASPGAGMLPLPTGDDGSAGAGVEPEQSLFDSWLSGATGSPESAVPSEATSTSDEQGLTNSAEEQEFPMGRYDDADGHSAEGQHLSIVQTCLLCGNDNAGWQFEGLPVHLPCWWNSTAASRAAATGHSTSSSAADDIAEIEPDAEFDFLEPEPNAGDIDDDIAALADDVDTVTPTHAVVAAAEPAVVEPSAVKTTAPRKAPAGSAAKWEYSAAAAVLDIDGVWMPDGTRHELPKQFTHVGHVADLVPALNLGMWKNDRWTTPGQIWVTDAMAQHFGIDTESLGKRNRNERLRELTAELPFVTDALADGWQLGGKPGDRLGTWTRAWHGESRGVWIALVPGMNADPGEMPILSDNPTPATLARRLSLFASALRFPWMISPAATGVDLMIAARPKDWKREFSSSDPEFAKQFRVFEGDFDWSRKPTDAELSCRYLHAYDRGGSYAAGIAGLELPIGEPVHHPDGIAFDKKLPGYWLVEVGEPGDWRYPHPLNPMGHATSEAKWVTTPTLERAAALGHEPAILKAWVWPEHGRVLVPWYERIRDARTALDIDDVDAQLARSQNKVMYTHTIGMLNSHQFLAGQNGYSPERHFHIVAKSRANILYRIVQIGTDTGHWPVAVTKDTIIYASDNPDPHASWPGEQKQYGRGFGQYKWEGSALLADHVQHLTGLGYRGKDELTEGVLDEAVVVGGDQ